MQNNSFFRTILVALVLCIVGALLVSGVTVSLRDRQMVNAALDKKKNVLVAAGLLDTNKEMSSSELKKAVDEAFKNIKRFVIVRETGEISSDDPEKFNEDAALQADTAKWYSAKEAYGKSIKVPEKVLVYEVFDDNGKLKAFILPIYGQGLWSTMRGFLAIDASSLSVIGITYYDQKETPGLGGEVENPKWKKLWEGRKIYDRDMKVAFSVIKGNAGSVEKDPYHVDGLSGATLTANGVTTMIQFWFSELGYLKFLEKNKI